MRKKLENYAFSKQEIKILREIASENHSLSSLRKSLSIKPNLLSYNLKRLLKKGIIVFQKKASPYKENREGRKKYVYFHDSKHAALLKELLLTYSHINWEDVLSNLGIEVLFQIADHSTVSFENFSAVTFWRLSRNLMAHGIIESDRGIFKISSRFSILTDFLKEYERHIITTVINSVSEMAVILWQRDMECLVRMPPNVKVDQKGFLKTATSLFDSFGIKLLSDSEVYFYSKKKKKIRTEDAILHTLLIDRNNVRYVTYSLLLLKKESAQIDKEYLLKEATSLELNLQVNAMLEFLKTRGAHKGLTLPTWPEFLSKARDYGVTD